MATVDLHHYMIFLAFCERRSDEEDIHWMLLLAHPGVDRCIRLHCEGAPDDRRYVSETNAAFSAIAGDSDQSWKIESKTYLSRIPSTALQTVYKQAEATPLQSSAFWVLYLLFRLERKNLIPEDTYTDWVCYHVSGEENDNETKDMDDQGPGNLWTDEDVSKAHSVPR